MTWGAFDIGLGVCPPMLVYMSALRFFTYPVAVVTEVQTLGEKRLFYSCDMIFTA